MTNDKSLMTNPTEPQDPGAGQCRPDQQRQGLGDFAASSPVPPPPCAEIGGDVDESEPPPWLVMVVPSYLI